MGRIQTAFNCIAVVGAAIHILAGIIAVYYLIPKTNATQEEILSRRSRSIIDRPILNINNSATSNEQCSAETCADCVSLSTDCIWFDGGEKSGCFLIQKESFSKMRTELATVFAEGIENVSWGSCEMPLAVVFFATVSIAVIFLVILAFLLVHLICKPSPEEKMLIEVTHAVKKEKILKRLGRLNPLPNNNQDVTTNNNV